jgi:hypothetical protein
MSKEKKECQQQFASLMRQCAKIAESDPEVAHVEADKAMCLILEETGFHEGVAIFRDMTKWYA